MHAEESEYFLSGVHELPTWLSIVRKRITLLFLDKKKNHF
jgi:hypothetical protein